MSTANIAEYLRNIGTPAALAAADIVERHEKLLALIKNSYQPVNRLLLDGKWAHPRGWNDCLTLLLNRIETNNLASEPREPPPPPPPPKELPHDDLLDAQPADDERTYADESGPDEPARPWWDRD